MNEILQAKLDELNNAKDTECWYIVKQETIFFKLCYFVSFLQEYQNLTDKKTNISDFMKQRQTEEKSKSGITIDHDYRALKVAANFGLIIDANKYENAVISNVFIEIQNRCNGKFEETNKYKDIIKRQLEKLFCSSKIDNKYNSERKLYRIFPIMFLYKILLELGKTEGRYEISELEYQTIIPTTKKYDDYLDTLFYIKLLRADSNAQIEFSKLKNKFNDKSRFQILLKNNSDMFNFSENKILLKPEKIEEVSKKVYLYEQQLPNFDEDEYIDFLCSDKYLIDTTIPLPHNRILFGAPGTGKSHKLKKDSNFFENQTVSTETTEKNLFISDFQKMKDFSQAPFCIAFGVKYSKFILDPKNNFEDVLSKLSSNPHNNFSDLKNAALIVDILKEKDYDKEDIEISQLLKNEYEKIKTQKNVIANLYALGFACSDRIIAAYSKPEIIASDIKNEVGYHPSAIFTGAKAKEIFDTLKSTTIQKKSFIERVTFHPNYSYVNFVGTYKPVQDKTDSTQIKYEYVPGPFMRTYAKAKLAEQNHTGENFLLIIEEINRANVAAVFGDVFQLLDRKNKGDSEYPINASEDIKNFLIKEHKFTEEEAKTLSIPKNMYIWATMNSADQGVFPMDTAFKRRWEFEYIGIDDGADDKNNPDYKNYKIPLQIKRDEKNNSKEVLCYNWDLLRRKINESLLKNANYVNEDKLLGPYFLNKTQLENIQNELKDNCEIEKIESFLKSFKSKVLMYLFEDVVKMRPQDFFDCQERSFSKICEKFNEEGLAVFKDIKEDETFKSESFSNKNANDSSSIDSESSSE